MSGGTRIASFAGKTHLRWEGTFIPSRERSDAGPSGKRSAGPSTREARGLAARPRRATLTVMYWLRRVLAVWCCAAALAAAPVFGQAAESSLFHVFLTDGSSLTSYGEWARVDEHIVFSIPLGARTGGALQLVTLPAARVDWRRTEAYRDRLRATHYAAGRGTEDFAALTGEVARTLNEIALQPDPAARLQRAERARAALASWPVAHYGFKAVEVREMVGMLDEIIGELRAAAGLSRFELSLTSEAPPPVEPMLPAPGDQQILDQLMTAASLSTTSTERTSILRTVLSLLDRAADALPAAWAAQLRKTALGRLSADERVDRAYRELRTSSIRDAARHAAAADVRALERLRKKVSARDASLGRRRPNEIVAVLATVNAQLDAARRLRLARDQWLVRSVAYETYERAMKPPLETLSGATSSLEAIRAMAGPSPKLLRTLMARLKLETSRLALVATPAELTPVHAVIRSAWELAASAVQLRLNAVASNDLDKARQASSAAAGALMLAARARTDLQAAIAPPHLP